MEKNRSKCAEQRGYVSKETVARRRWGILEDNLVWIRSDEGLLNCSNLLFFH